MFSSDGECGQLSLGTSEILPFSLFVELQTTASESTFVALLAARTEAIRRYKAVTPDIDDAEINARLVAYCSDQVCIAMLRTGQKSPPGSHHVIATFKNVLFPAHNHMLTTSTDDLTLWCSGDN